MVLFTFGLGFCLGRRFGGCYCSCWSGGWSRCCSGGGCFGGGSCRCSGSGWCSWSGRLSCGCRRLSECTHGNKTSDQGCENFFHISSLSGLLSLQKIWMHHHNEASANSVDKELLTPSKCGGQHRTHTRVLSFDGQVVLVKLEHGCPKVGQYQLAWLGSVQCLLLRLEFRSGAGRTRIGKLHRVHRVASMDTLGQTNAPVSALGKSAARATASPDTKALRNSSSLAIAPSNASLPSSK